MESCGTQKLLIGSKEFLAQLLPPGVRVPILSLSGILTIFFLNIFFYCEMLQLCTLMILSGSAFREASLRILTRAVALGQSKEFVDNLTLCARVRWQYLAPNLQEFSNYLNTDKLKYLFITIT